MEGWIKAIIFLAIYMGIGLLAFEWAWGKVRPLREVDEERDSKYPAFRRPDAKGWRRWKFLPGAVTLLPLRMVMGVILVILCYICTWILTRGHRFTDENHITGCRATAIRYVFKFFSAALMFSIGMRSTRRKVDYDYSEYLGPNYKKEQILPKHVSTLIVNHSTWIDTQMLVQYYMNAFVSKEGLRNAPAFGLISQAMGCIFIKRDAGVGVKNDVIGQISERQRLTEEFGEFPPLVIFPEGGTSNGTCILPFKRGAFSALRAVTPIVMKTSYMVMSPCYDVCPFVPLCIMNYCLLDVHFDILELPPFLPNEYLYRNHADKITPVVPASTTDAPVLSAPAGQLDH